MLCKLRDIHIGELILARLKALHTNTYLNTVGPNVPELNPVLAGHFIEFMASTTYGLLEHWSDENMRHSPEVMAKLLFSLTGPPTLTRIPEKFQDMIT